MDNEETVKLLKRACPKKTRLNSINRCLGVLGVNPKLLYCYSSGHKEGKYGAKGSIYDRLGEEEILRLADEHYRKLIREYHPDRHHGDGLYDDYAKIINQAYQAIYRIIEGRKRSATQKGTIIVRANDKIYRYNYG